MDTSPMTDYSGIAPNKARLVIFWLGLLILLTLVVGVLLALFWVNVVDLPVWRVRSDGSAAMTEAGWTQMIAIDAWFVGCAVLVGPGIGYVGWRWFKSLGWPVALIAAIAGLVTGLVCVQFGNIFGPGSFPERIAAASLGDLVPVEFGLQSWSAVAVWPLAAVLPVFFAAAFGRDDEDELPVPFGDDSGRAPEGVAELDERAN